MVLERHCERARVHQPRGCRHAVLEAGSPLRGLVLVPGREEGGPLGGSGAGSPGPGSTLSPAGVPPEDASLGCPSVERGSVSVHL